MPTRKRTSLLRVFPHRRPAVPDSAKIIEFRAKPRPHVFFRLLLHSERRRQRLLVLKASERRLQLSFHTHPYAVPDREGAHVLRRRYTSSFAAQARDLRTRDPLCACHPDGIKENTQECSPLDYTQPLPYTTSHNKTFNRAVFLYVGPPTTSPVTQTLDKKKHPNFTNPTRSPDTPRPSLSAPTTRTLGTRQTRHARQRDKEHSRTNLCCGRP